MAKGPSSSTCGSTATSSTTPTAPSPSATSTSTAGTRTPTAGTGDAFFEDTIGPKPLRIAHPQHVWARQLNIEFGEKPLVENHGGTLWLLGYKTEGQMVCIQQTAGKTELLGGLIYPLRNVPGGTPAFLIEGGEAALSYAMSGPKYPNQVRSTVRGGEQTLKGDDVGWRAAALVDVAAGRTCKPPSTGKVEPAVIDADGGVPFWKREATEPRRCLPRRCRHDLRRPRHRQHQRPAAPRPLEAAAVEQRCPAVGGRKPAGPGPDLRARAAPSAADPAAGTSSGSVILPPKPGRYRLTGEAMADTWGPDGPIRVIVQVVDDDRDEEVRPILDTSVADRSTIDWSDHEAVQNIELRQDESLLLTFTAERGGTASLDLAPTNSPTALEAVE